MRISAVPSPSNIMGNISGGPAEAASAPVAQRIRSLKMNTNATPGNYFDGSAAQELTMPSAIDPAETANEATKPLSPQFAALAKQRRALQVKERELQDRAKALEAQSQGGTVDIARLKSSPLSFLLENGVTYEQLTEEILSSRDGHNSQVHALEAKIKALEEGVDKKLTDRDAQAEQQVLAEMRREALSLVAQGDAFELVRETRSVPDVMRLIETTYRKTGEVIPVAEALKDVEEDLLNESLKLTKLSKLQSRLAPPPAPMPPQRAFGMRTLTNRDTASVPVSAKARAVAAFYGTLKK